MNTTLGFTASATEAKASLRFWRLPSAAVEGAAGVPAAYRVSCCCAADEPGRWRSAGEQQAGEKGQYDAADGEPAQRTLGHLEHLLRGKHGAGATRLSI